MSENTALSRREVLTKAAVVGAGVAAFGLLESQRSVAYAEAEAIASDTEPTTQYGFRVNTAHCVNCQKCVAACRRANSTPETSEARRKVEVYESDFGKKLYVSLSCMHCEKPSCMEVCPAKAISKRSDGIVVVDHNRCIGCKYCYQACPFGVPKYGTNGMDKCDCCLEAGVPAGEEPNCVRACIFGALSYGVLDDMEAASHGTAKRIEAQTGPSYLLV